MRLIILLLTLLISINACAKDDIFSKYPVNNIYKGGFFELVYDENKMSLEYYNTTKKELSKGVGFSGKYVVVITALGNMKIRAGTVVNVNNGKAYDFPTIYAIDDTLEFDIKFKKDSSAICISGTDAYNGKIYKNKCYNFKEGKFIPIN
ncbi:hypothetical protein [Sulfurimonas sp.]|uniref:hypothetical protein n=1 Tax=Sulfurimonas sp. TaxID=2022749 RepID=UPI002B47841E|nr:hypothetical protein [Sulfurimonas sp.]